MYQICKFRKYLGVLITNDLYDDLDINRHLRYLYCVDNTLHLKFHNCSSQVKNVLFRSYCMFIYSVHLWCKFKISSLNRVGIAYKNSFRILYNIPRQESARTRQIQSNLETFDAVIRNYLYSFLKRCNNSSNVYISCLMSSDSKFLMSHRENVSHTACICRQRGRVVKAPD